MNPTHDRQEATPDRRLLQSELGDLRERTGADKPDLTVSITHVDVEAETDAEMNRLLLATPATDGGNPSTGNHDVGRHAGRPPARNSTSHVRRPGDSRYASGPSTDGDAVIRYTRRGLRRRRGRRYTSGISWVPGRRQTNWSTRYPSEHRRTVATPNNRLFFANLVKIPK